MDQSLRLLIKRYNEREIMKEYDEMGSYNREDAEQAQREAGEERAYLRDSALTPQGRLDALQKRLRIECGSVARSYGDEDVIDILEKELYSQIKVAKVEAEAARKEYLAQRRPA